MNDTQTALLDHYLKLSAQLKRYERAARRAHDKAEKVRQARDGLRVAMELDGSWSDEYESPNGAHRVLSDRGTLTKAIREVLPEIQGLITVNNVIDAVNLKSPGLIKQGKASSVSRALRRLTDDGILEILKKGHGKRPSEYCLPETTGLPANNDGGGGHDS